MQNLEEKLLAEYPGLARAKEYGIDVVMLYDNVQRPVIERIRRHQIALNTFKLLYNTANMQTKKGRE